MSKTSGALGESPIYRIDKFSVPNPARQEFLERVRQTHHILRQQPGFVRDLILEQSGGPSEFNIVTLVEWHREAALGAVQATVAAFHKELGFDPQEMVARLGIKADIAFYRRLESE